MILPDLVVWNDCANDWRTIVYELRKKGMRVEHFLRTRGLFDKTAGLAWRIFRAPSASCWVANYLLQDTYLILKLKQKKGVKVIAESHGSDIRMALKTRRYGWIVRYCLTHADKIFVADKDTLETAKEYNDSAEWLPIPIRLDLFTPTELPARKEFIIFYPNAISEKIRGSLTFLHAYANFAKQYRKTKLKIVNWGPDLAAAKSLVNKLDINYYVVWIDPVPYPAGIIKEYCESDCVIGVFKSGIYPSTTLEAMACNRPVLNYTRDDLYPTFQRASAHTEEEIIEQLYRLSNLKYRQEIAKDGMDYVKMFHNSKLIAEKVYDTYREITS